MIWRWFSWSCLDSKSAEFLNVLNDQVIPTMDFFFPDGLGIFQDDNAKIHQVHQDWTWNQNTTFLGEQKYFILRVFHEMKVNNT